MYELIQAGKHTYYMDCPSRSGIYLINSSDICIIDGGSDKASAKKLSAHIEEKGWNPVLLLNTHSHADHDGGNAFLQQKYNIPVSCSNPDAMLIENTLIQPTTLYGAYPNKDMLGKFFYAQPSTVTPISQINMPEGLTYETFPGHSPNQTAYKTRDNMWFIGDVLTPQTTIEKYHISYLYNIEEHLNSLEKLKHTEGELFIPSHGPVMENTADIIEINIQHVKDILAFLTEQCKTPHSIDELMKAFFDTSGMTLSLSQHLLCGATFRSYMSYLYNNDTVGVVFDDNIMRYILK